MMPRVSVVIPLYQTEAYIADRAALRAGPDVRAISRSIVVDDGSRDGGPEIARVHAGMRACAS